VIWFKPYTLADLAKLGNKKILTQVLDITIAEIGDDYLCARMPVNTQVHQINGILHGGATCVLVETVASVASYLCLDPASQYAVGSVIHVNHLRPVSDGYIIANCKPIHLGKQKHVWDVSVMHEDSNKLIAKGELTCAVINQYMPTLG
jgi:1,4-dihydroxy-2-naphthoyl-CoA hydrolase